jgi:hypothetical protein
MSSPEKTTKLFTVEEANATLPLVSAIMNDLATLSRELVERRQRLDHLQVGREAEEGDPYAEELSQIQEELDGQISQLQEYVNELRVLGVEPKNGPDGLIDLVDFPAKIDGQRVYLCWRLGEPEVSFWHDIETGFAGRQQIPTATAVDTSSGPSHDLGAD